ncbi:MAG: hypothetical protein ISS16_02855 [Ignavibacteria bacterium]|nr:hypothetical protein [Ignavibacteria bacterium]
MKAIIRFFSIKVTVAILNVVLLLAIIAVYDNSLPLNKKNHTEFLDEDCYTYERVYISGEWWIYVYNCDGILVKTYIDN